MLRASSLSAEFVELVMKLYQDQGEDLAWSVANNLLFDLAHALGRADAKAFQTKMGVTDPIERLPPPTPPWSPSLEGFVKARHGRSEETRGAWRR